MEKDIVLAKFFQLTDKMKSHREAQRKLEDFSPENHLFIKIPHSGKNLLRVLLKNGSLNQRSIAKLMEISSQAVSESVKKLEQNELIIKTCGQQNNENIIELTEKGREIAIKLDKGIKKHAESLFAKLTEEETEQFYQILKKLLED